MKIKRCYISILCLMLFFISCETKKTEVEVNAFDINKYSQDNYMQNLNLLIQKEEINLSKFTYAIVYTKKRQGPTASCVKETVLGSMVELVPLADKIVVISNDASFVPNGFEKQLFDDQKFEEYNIFHSTPYIYEIINGKLSNGEIFSNEKIEELKAIG